MLSSKSFKVVPLEWVEIEKAELESLERFPGESNGYRVFLSPDVKSLHLLWVHMENMDWSHEIVDYGDYQGLKELLRKELYDDSWDSGEFESEAEMYETLSDWKDYSEENPPKVLAIKDIVKSRHELLKELGVIQ